MEKSNNRICVQRGPPPDPRQATRRAHQQPWIGATDASRGLHQQPRTDVTKVNRGKNNKELYICTYNTRTINDLNQDSLNTMMIELEKVNWSLIGLAETKVKENKIERLESGAQLFLSGNNMSRSNGVGFLVHKSFCTACGTLQPNF